LSTARARILYGGRGYRPAIDVDRREDRSSCPPQPIEKHGFADERRGAHLERHPPRVSKPFDLAVSGHDRGQSRDVVAVDCSGNFAGADGDGIERPAHDRVDGIHGRGGPVRSAGNGRAGRGHRARPAAGCARAGTRRRFIQQAEPHPGPQRGQRARMSDRRPDRGAGARRDGNARPDLPPADRRLRRRWSRRHRSRNRQQRPTSGPGFVADRARARAGRAARSLHFGAGPGRGFRRPARFQVLAGPAPAPPPGAG
jgi:hypothetical protein